MWKLKLINICVVKSVTYSDDKAVEVKTLDGGQPDCRSRLQPPASGLR